MNSFKQRTSPHHTLFAEIKPLYRYISTFCAGALLLFMWWKGIYIYTQAKIQSYKTNTAQLHDTAVNYKRALSMRKKLLGTIATLQQELGQLDISDSFAREQELIMQLMIMAERMGLSLNSCVVGNVKLQQHMRSRELHLVVDGDMEAQISFLRNIKDSAMLEIQKIQLRLLENNRASLICVGSLHTFLA